METDVRSAPQVSRRLTDVLEALGLRRGASVVGFGAAEALAPARGTALGAFLGAACWAVVAALAWAIAR